MEMPPNFKHERLVESYECPFETSHSPFGIGYVKMFSEFLNETSIHGLRYLQQARHPLIKLLWFACIATCVGFAALIIYLNVKNWENSPTVVTSVQPTVVTGLPYMPMISICPLFGSSAELIFNLLTYNNSQCPKENPELVDEITSTLVRNTIRFKADIQRVPPFKKDTYLLKPMFSPCDDDEEMKSSDPCRTVFLFASISYLNQFYPGVMLNFNYVFDYLYDQIDSTTGASREDFLNFTEATIGMTVDVKERLPTYVYWYSDMIRLYTMFFPVWKDRIVGGEFEPLRDLSEYESPKVEGVTPDNVGSLLAHLIDQRKADTFSGDVVAGQMYSETASKALIACINSHIDISPTLIMQFLDAYSYPPGFALLGQKKNSEDYNANPCQVEHLNQPLKDVCNSSPPLGKESKCNDYCRMIEKGARKTKKIRKLLNMAMDYAGPLVPGNPRSLLPVCRFPGEGVSSEGCWRRVATEKGYCFTSQTELGRSTITGIGEKHAFTFGLDYGAKFDLVSNVTGYSITQSPGVDIIVTPPFQHAIGMLTEEKYALFRYSPHAIHEYALEWNLEVELDYMAGATEDFRSLRPEKRKCYYENENKLLQFPFYSETNCILECSWLHAIKKCGCAPWFLELKLDRDVPLCEVYGNYCFKNVVENRLKLPECSLNCLPDCQRVNYKVEHHKSSFIRADPKTLIFYDYLTKNKTQNAEAAVREAMKPVSIEPPTESIFLVKVWVNKKTTLGMIMTATVTLIDMISNIGGTLGLFCGVSILSGVEILYWAGQMLIKKKGPFGF